MSKVRVLGLTKKDFRFDFYRGSGKGGQKRNKTSNYARCTHPASGAVGQGEEGRSQIHNKRIAFERCVATEKFRRWLRMEVAKRTGALADAQEAVDRAMKPWNLRVEGWSSKEEHWVPLETPVDV